jgi:hypothetical protein
MATVPAATINVTMRNRFMFGTPVCPSYSEVGIEVDRPKRDYANVFGPGCSDVSNIAQTLSCAGSYLSGRAIWKGGAMTLDDISTERLHLMRKSMEDFNVQNDTRYRSRRCCPWRRYDGHPCSRRPIRQLRHHPCSPIGSGHLLPAALDQAARALYEWLGKGRARTALPSVTDSMGRPSKANAQASAGRRGRGISRGF